MNIEDLEKKLYKKGVKEDEYGARPEIPEAFLPGEKGYQSPSAVPAWRGSRNTARQTFWNASRKAMLIRGLWIGGAILLMLGVFSAWQAFFAFDKSKLQVEIFGPDRIVSGENINYIVKYKNNAMVGLKNANLALELPEGGIYVGDNSSTLVKEVELGEIKSQSEGQQSFSVQIMGLRGAGKKITAKLIYRPANIKFSFENKAEFKSAIISVPIVLDFDLPERTVSGQTVNLTLNYLNTSSADFSDLKLKIEYPKGWQFISAHPEPDEENNIWAVNLGDHEEGKIIVSGVLTGDQNDIKSFKAQVGVERNGNFLSMAEALNSSRISLAPLNITQTVNDSENYTASIKDQLRYKIKYQNSTDVAIPNAIITVKLDSNILDDRNFRPQNSFYNAATKTITWNVSSLPELRFLAPHSESILYFEIGVKDNLPINSFADKNFVITSMAKIDSPNVPLSLIGTQISGEHQLSIKLNSPLTLNIKGYYNDNLIPNSGPIPPIVGQMTTYTIYWQVINPSNDADSLEVSAYLPSYMHWANKFEPKDADIKYDISTGKLTWRINNLPSGTGVLLPVKYVAFQLGLVPALNQVGSTVDVIQQSIIKAHDLFTDQILTYQTNALSSAMPDDPFIGYGRGIVTE